MSNLFSTIDYMIMHFIPFLIVPFFFAIILIGMLIKFLRNGRMDI
jgi:hypothetical protein